MRAPARRSAPPSAKKGGQGRRRVAPQKRASPHRKKTGREDPLFRLLPASFSKGGEDEAVANLYFPFKKKARLLLLYLTGGRRGGGCGTAARTLEMTRTNNATWRPYPKKKKEREKREESGCAGA